METTVEHFTPLACGVIRDDVPTKGRQGCEVTKLLTCLTCNIIKIAV